MIDHHFEELRKESGPVATRFVRELTAGELSERDANEEAEYLSPHHLTGQRGKNATTSFVHHWVLRWKATARATF